MPKAFVRTVFGKASLVAALVLPWLTAVSGAAAGPETVKADDRKAWFDAARFGMFVHWGIYSVTEGEWQGKNRYESWLMQQVSMPVTNYVQFAARFNPVKFDASEWVRVAKKAGMKYMVFTAKHHDGFCMYDTALTDYNVVKATPFRRDPVKELAAACRDGGLTFCVYYSIPDWHHPEFPAKYSQRGFHGDPKPDADLEKYVAFMRGQVRELLTNYGPIGIMWFDGGGAFRPDESIMPGLIHASEMIDMIHQIQPTCLVNDRLGIPGDYGTPESHVPGERPSATFEVCMSLNKHWGYNKADNNWKEPPQTLRYLVDVASKGGNYLLNVGPTPEGLIQPDAVRILGEVGKWMSINGESIYNTVASPSKALPAWGRATGGDGRVYLHVFDWPADGKLVVQGWSGAPRKAYMLADTAKQPLDFTVAGDALTLKLPANAPDKVDSVVVVETR